MRSPSRPHPCRRSGYTIIELLAVMVIIGVLAGFGVPKLKQVVQKAKTARAIGDIRAIQIDLMALEAQGVPLPADLSGIGRGGILDPWGRPYVYFPFDTTGHGNPPGARRDRFLVPINSTFDLYSVGPDGSTALPLTANPSRDDIVRANDGGYIGVASQF
jgi:general secretion pathway protein G